MKLEQGDLFELKYASWIRESLPTYENVWAAFIGHKGNGQPMEIFDLPVEQQERRKLFYQAHYSFAVSAFRLDKLVKWNSNSTESIDRLLDEHERFFLFMAYVGHIRDMFMQMDKALGADGNLFKEFQNFYDQRSHILHGSRIAFGLDDFSFFIPTVSERNEKLGEWHKNASWDSVDFGKRAYIFDFISKIREELFSLINKNHSKVFNAADKFFEGKRISATVSSELLDTIDYADRSKSESGKAPSLRINDATAAASGCFIAPSGNILSGTQNIPPLEP